MRILFAFPALVPLVLAASAHAAPDLVVDSVAPDPAVPLAGEAVAFSCVVRNAGADPVPEGVTIGVAYKVDGVQKTWGSVPGPLAPGATAAVPAQGGFWSAAAGSHAVTAVVDDVNRVAEADETNNTRGASFTVKPAIPPATKNTLFGMNIDPENPAGAPSPRELKDAGARWVRLEWKAHLGNAFFDPRVASFRAHGLRVLLLVDYASVPGKPPTGSGDDAWAAYLPKFIEGAGAIAKHFGNGVDAWQLWNEPDLKPSEGYDPGVPPRHFGTMLRDAAKAIRAHSSRPVVTAGLAGFDPSYLAQARDAAGGLTVDAVAIQTYLHRAPDGWPSPRYGKGNLSELLDQYLAFGKPVWITEINMNTKNQSMQADYLANVYKLAGEKYAGRVPVVFTFCWSDGMVPPYGVRDAVGKPKTALDKYRAAAGAW